MATVWTLRTLALGLGLSAATVESVVAQIQRGERGIPLHPKTITIEGAWVDGPTLRNQRAGTTD